MTTLASQVRVDHGPRRGFFGFVVRRLLQTIPILLGVLLLVFMLLQVTPGDPARTIAGRQASPADLERIREDLGLNEPLPAQYVGYVGDVAQGDFGTSIRQNVPVTEVIGDRLPISLALIALSVVFATLISVPLALLAARRRDRLADHAVRGVSLVALTMPPFWVGILLLVLVALPTGWFPTSGYGDTFTEHLRALVLPSLTLGIAMSPLLVRAMRTEYIGVRESDYIAMARASGVPTSRRILRHELPNAVLPAITLTALSIGYLLFGAVVVENTFALPGLGQAMVNAVADRDIPVIQGITLVFALIVVAVYFVTDILYALVDPRIELR